MASRRYMDITRLVLKPNTEIMEGFQNNSIVVATHSGNNLLSIRSVINLFCDLIFILIYEMNL